MGATDRRFARRASKISFGAESDSDEALMVRVADGEVAALGVFYDRFSHRVHSLARQMCGHDDAAAEDVVEDVFLEVWRRSTHFHRDCGSVAVWLMTLTHHKAVDAIRRSAIRRGALYCDTCPDNDHGEMNGPGVEQAAIDRPVAGDLRGALAQLPPLCRRTLALTFGGYTQREVAVILGIPLDVVKERTSSAMAHLHEQMQESD